MYVFGYGSLLSTSSAASTIPGLEVDRCIPARLDGHIRTFDVAFPNDGSQPDKAYVSADGTRPDVVLFANVRPAEGSAPANGVLLPVADGDLDRLVERERRYHIIDVTERVRSYPGWAQPGAPVLAFQGRAEFTTRDATAGGVLGTDYLTTIVAGVAEWANRCARFAADFGESTRMPPDARLLPLRRAAAGRGDHSRTGRWQRESGPTPAPCCRR